MSGPQLSINNCQNGVLSINIMVDFLAHLFEFNQFKLRIVGIFLAFLAVTQNEVPESCVILLTWNSFEVGHTLSNAPKNH